MRILGYFFLLATLFTIPGCKSKLPEGEVERIPEGNQEYYKNYYQTPPVK